jgi:hypothetical protein
VGTWCPAAGEPEDDAVHRLGVALARAGLGDTVELGPLAPGEIEALVARGSGAPLPAAVAEEVRARSEGNPFFAQELLAAALRGEDALPRVLRDVLLADFGRLCPQSRAVARVAAAAGRAVPHRLLTAAAGLPQDEVVEALRGAVDHGVLVADHRSATYRFRHALIAEAVYGTLLPGEREAVHERLAGALADEPKLAATGAVAAELAEHWLAAGRLAEALTASLRAAREAQAVSGLSEALHHLERVLDLWDDVPRAQELTGVAMPALLAWAADLAGTGERIGTGIGVAEARELYPLAVVLESVAIRRSPPLRADALGALRAANARLRAAAHDAVAASAADDEFHRHLVAGCGDAPLLGALRPLKRALLRYEHVYMDDPVRIERSAAQHDAIVEALARGDHGEAAQRLRRNLTSGLPDLTPELER